jgi:phosphatidate phosphatase LPIN
MKLPDGPILMSPDGLVSSFKREIIDRIPQSFKIECLTQLVNLFPPDNKPYFAGFGNRTTDAIAYEAVGISRNKIFLINEKGEITQYNHYYKTSYININEMVYEMFPPLTGNNTFFGSLNYFKPNFKSIDVNKLFD